MQPQPQSIGRVAVLASSVGLLLVIFGCVIALTGMADRSLAPVPVRGAGAQSLSEARTPSPSATHPAGTRTAPGRDSMSIANRDHGQPQAGFAAQRAAATLPVVDRSRDRRADLMDMASSIRWYRGAAPDLPPVSNITGTSAG